MTRTDLQQEIVRRGITTLEAVPDTHERASLLEAAADLLTDEELSIRCRATASCLREAEAAQLSLFNSFRR